MQSRKYTIKKKKINNEQYTLRGATILIGEKTAVRTSLGHYIAILH